MSLYIHMCIGIKITVVIIVELNQTCSYNYLSIHVAHFHQVPVTQQNLFGVLTESDRIHVLITLPDSFPLVYGGLREQGVWNGNRLD